MDGKKIVLAGIVAGIVMFIIGMISGTSTADVYKATPELWKEMGISWFYSAFIYNIIVGLIVAGVYSAIRKGIPHKGIRKGVMYGFLVWLLAIIPGMGITYLTMAVPDVLIVVWTLGGLIEYLLMGMVVVKIIGD